MRKFTIAEHPPACHNQNMDANRLAEMQKYLSELERGLLMTAKAVEKIRVLIATSPEFIETTQPSKSNTASD